jgi:hypothetical protein
MREARCEAYFPKEKTRSDAGFFMRARKLAGKRAMK